MSKAYNKNTALVMCVLGGWFGLHYFYVKKIGIGILYLFTFGLFCIGWWVDIYRICAGKFIKNSVSPPSVKSTADSDYWQFVDEHEKEFDRLVERYQKACYNSESACTDCESAAYRNIDKRLNALETAISIFDDIDLFCTGKVGGIEYLAKEYPNFSAPYISGYDFTDNEESFSDCDFENYEFLKFLHSQYLDNYSLYRESFKNL